MCVCVFVGPSFMDAKACVLNQVETSAESAESDSLLVYGAEQIVN